MRIAVLPSPNRVDGGIFQYGLSLLEAVDAEHVAGRTGRPLLVHPKQTDLPVDDLRRRGWECVEFPFPSRARKLLDPLRRIVGEGRLRRAWRRLRQPEEETLPDVGTIVHRPELRERFRQLGVDLLLLGYPNALGFEIGLPYVMPIHDMQHRLQPEFPEVSAGGEWERREYVYGNGAVHATVVLADSEIGKQDILDCYGDQGVRSDRIEILPLMPPPYMRELANEQARSEVRARYSLPDRYVFYPAQFWPHKNHERIVEALGLLRDEGLRVTAVFAGSWSGDLRGRTYQRVQQRANELGVTDLVRTLGYVPDEDFPALLAGSEALVMPTFFGPTNIPPLEAWVVGTPVITSDIRGIREHAGSASILVDPRSSESIATAIRSIWTDESVRARLREAGTVRLRDLTDDDYRRRVRRVLEVAETAPAPPVS